MDVAVGKGCDDGVSNVMIFLLLLWVWLPLPSSPSPSPRALSRSSPDCVEVCEGDVLPMVGMALRFNWLLLLL